ncbi:hypothetical protein [Roseovarius sp. A-2]|uniref:hypothetical protein n=1 Tax=Roseovarius sp. A-2 TaxID=1570360 RepID=UPI001592C532|nr:hypothetical protein [Roseovarius sp. A-2]
MAGMITDSFQAKATTAFLWLVRFFFAILHRLVRYATHHNNWSEFPRPRLF